MLNAWSYEQIGKPINSTFHQVLMMLNQKGQESAPFELLIAIVMMTFVIVVGFQAIDTLNEETCRGLLNQNMEEIKRGVETVVQTKSKVTLSYELPNCFSEDNPNTDVIESSLRIIDRKDRVYCSALCGGSLAQCTILRFSSPTFTETKCLRISAATYFPDETKCDADALEPPGAFGVEQWKSLEGIAPGQYTLIRQSNLFSGSPQICVYKRK